MPDTSDLLSSLPSLNLPKASLKVRYGLGVVQIFDHLRKKWVVLTPEEWVRQNFVEALINQFHYPASLIANEIGIVVNGTRKRCDTVVFDNHGEPLIIVEYKAPHVKITQDVFDQIVRYNMRLKAHYLIVSNGLQHYCSKIDYNTDSYAFIPTIPGWLDSISGNN